MPGHQRDERSRVDAARQEGAERHVGDQTGTHGFVEPVADSLRRLLRPEAGIDFVAKLPVLAEREGAPFRHEEVSGWKLFDSLERRDRLGDVEIGEEMMDGGWPKLSRNARVRQQAFDLGAPDELPVSNGVVELLDSHPVAREEQAFPATVPEREGEHPVAALHEVVAELFVGVNDHFGVGRRSKAMTARLELAPQLAKVVDLAVEDDPDAAVFVGDRLVSPADVDDREAAHGEADMARILVTAVAVRAPVHDRLVHRLERGEIDRPSPAQGVDSDDSAHRQRLARTTARRRTASWQASWRRSGWRRIRATSRGHEGFRSTFMASPIRECIPRGHRRSWHRFLSDSSIAGAGIGDGGARLKQRDPERMTRVRVPWRAPGKLQPMRARSEPPAGCQGRAIDRWLWLATAGQSGSPGRDGATSER